MKWFKHFSDAGDNLKLKIVRREFGLEGYGFYWLCLELVASQGQDYQLTKDKEWKTELAISSNIEPEKVNKILERFADLKLIDKKSLIRGHLYLPKMEEYADEYTNKVRRVSGHTPDKVVLDKKKKRTEQIRTEEKIEEDTSLTPAQSMRLFVSSEEMQTLAVKNLVDKGAPEDIARKEINKFILYWTERNKSGTKEKWELQETFEVGRRLSTWLSRVREFNGFQQDKVTKV